MQASGGVVGEGKMGVRILSCKVLVDVGGGHPPRRTGRPGMQIEGDTLVDEEKTGGRVLSCEVLVVVRVLSSRVDVLVRGGHPPRRTGNPGMQIGREMVADGERVDPDADEVLLVLNGVVVVRVRSEVVVVEEGVCVVVVVVVVVVSGQPPSLTGRPGIHGSKGVDVLVTGAGVVVSAVVIVVGRGQPPRPSGRPGIQGLTVVEAGSAVADVEEEEELRDQTGQFRPADIAPKRRNTDLVVVVLRVVESGQPPRKSGRPGTQLGNTNLQAVLLAESSAYS